MAVDDATRLAYVEVVPDEQKATTVGFLVRAVSWFNSQGITCQRVLSDNGSAYRSRQWRQPCTVLCLKAKAQGPTGHRPAARRNISSIRYRRSRRMRCSSKAKKSASYGCRVIWRSITAAGATWPWQAAIPFSSSTSCGSLNNLGRKQI